MPREKFYAVDSIKKKHAVLVGDAGDSATVELEELPRGLTEGTVLRVPLDEHGAPDWATARRDEAETERRLREAEDLLRSLRRRDPGGDIEL
jgi:hypothetical protein